MNKGLIKGIASLIGGSCAGWVVDRYLKTNLNVTSRMETIALRIGSWIIGGLITAKASDYIEAEIDETQKLIKQIINAKENNIEEE